MVIKNDRLAPAGVTSIPRQARRKSEPTALSPEEKEKLPRRRRASSNTPPATSALKRHQMKQSKSYGALQKNSISTTSLKSAGSSGDFSKPKRHSDSDSVLISDLCPEQKPIGWKSQLLDALTLSSTSASASCLVEKPELPIPSPPKVPSIVVQSIKYLEKHGRFSPSELSVIESFNLRLNKRSPDYIINDHEVYIYISITLLCICSHKGFPIGCDGYS